MKHERLYVFFSIVTQCLFVNLLSILGILIGGVIFGIGPSVIAGHEVFKKYHLKNEETRTVKCFIETYKRNFIKGNQLILPVIIAGGILYIDTQLIHQHAFPMMIIVLSILAVIELLFISCCCCLFPLYLYYDIRFVQYYKKTFEYLCSNPVVILMSLLWMGFCFYGSLLLPGLIPVVSIGVWVFGNSAIFFRQFRKNEESLNTVI